MIPDFYKSGSYFDAIDKVSLTDSNMSEGAGSYIDLESGKSGIGILIVGNDQEHAIFTFNSNAEISLMLNTDNVSKTSVNDKIVIRDAGQNVRIVNELGSTVVIGLHIMYNV